MKYMDIGCSGGGFVYQFVTRGVFAVGVEGSDYSKKNKRSEWATIPDYLFTGDVTKPFHFVDEENNLLDLNNLKLVAQQDAGFEDHMMKQAYSYEEAKRKQEQLQQYPPSVPGNVRGNFFPGKSNSVTH